MANSVFRIHPSIGFARVGTSPEHYLAPETSAGEPGADGQPSGGLPIREGTESEPIRASDLRDDQKRMKRQAARFRIFAYAKPEGTETYPMGEPRAEVRIGSTVEIGGVTKTVRDIVWTVHVANKKANWYQSPDDDGIIAWGTPAAPQTPPLRNPGQGSDIGSTKRLHDLVIDPGPRAIHGASAGPVRFDRATPASYADGGGQPVQVGYPKSFPSDAFSPINPPGVEIIDTLGELRTDEHGRLIVNGGYGRANSFSTNAPEYDFTDAVNNDFWFDDTSDGPVTAVLLLDDGTTHVVEGDAWFVCTDPAYAPQIANVVSLWDDTYDSWVRKLALRPDLFTGGTFVADYPPSFADEVRPIFMAAGLQQWATNLSTLGISAHARLTRIAADTEPADTQLHGLGLIRKPVDPDALTPYDPENPNAIGNGRGDPEPSGDDRRMPMGLGDAGRSLLSLTETQYFYLTRWDRSAAQTSGIPLGFGEALDKASLQAGLGGRFSPGIDITYICRQPELYVMDWQTSGTGPFRIARKPLDYSSAGTAPFLGVGWTPRRNENAVEPGDVSKFMAVPWHADYNSCGTHLPAPNLPMANTLYWSWPAQRPVAVYVADDVESPDVLPDQRYSIRGPGTKTTLADPPQFGPQNPAEVGRYQESEVDANGNPTTPGIIRILDNWMKIGTVLQATQIDEPAKAYDPATYLEVASLFGNADETSDVVVPWPNTVKPGAGG